jgi:hypothetical protein
VPLIFLHTTLPFKINKKSTWHCYVRVHFSLSIVAFNQSNALVRLIFRNYFCLVNYPILIFSFYCIQFVSCADRDLRQQVESRGLTDVELGPDEHKLMLQGEPELKSNQQRQIEKLQNDLIQKQSEIDACKLRVSSV